MSFFRDTEFFIVMDLPKANGQWLSEDDLTKLYDKGECDTVMRFYNYWGDIETSRGVYDWRELDGYVERTLRIGLKVILPCYSAAPNWFPDTWYARLANGIQNNTDHLSGAGGLEVERHGKASVGYLDIWNEEAMAYSLRFYQLMHDRYTADKVIVSNSWFTDGETLYFNEPAWFSECAQASYKARYGSQAVPIMNDPLTEDWLRDSYIKVYMDQQRILVENPTRTIFTQVHPVIAAMTQFYGNGCKFIPELFTAMDALNADVNWFLYTWAQWAPIYPIINGLKDMHGYHLWGGAEYCEGLPTTTPVAIANCLRGQYIGPCHPYTNHLHIEPWMIDNFKQAYWLWANRHQECGG